MCLCTLADPRGLEWELIPLKATFTPSESEKDQRIIKKYRRISSNHQRKLSLSLSPDVNGPEGPNFYLILWGFQP